MSCFGKSKKMASTTALRRDLSMSKDMPDRWANVGFAAIVFNCDTGMSENGVHPQIDVLMGKMMINPWI